MKKLCMLWILSILMILALPIAVSASSSTDTELEAVYDRIENKYEDFYRDIMERANNADVIGEVIDNPDRWLIEKIYTVYRSVKKAALPISALSILGGVIAAWLVHKNRWLMRHIILSFVIGLPLLLCLFVFGVGILIG